LVLCFAQMIKRPYKKRMSTCQKYPEYQQQVRIVVQIIMTTMIMTNTLNI